MAPNTVKTGIGVLDNAFGGICLNFPTLVCGRRKKFISTLSSLDVTSLLLLPEPASPAATSLAGVLRELCPINIEKESHEFGANFVLRVTKFQSMAKESIPLEVTLDIVPGVGFGDPAAAGKPRLDEMVSVGPATEPKLAFRPFMSPSLASFSTNGIQGPAPSGPACVESARTPQPSQATPPPPPPAEEDDIAVVFQLSDYENTEVDERPEGDTLRYKGLKAYSAGAYHEATNLWTRWRDMDPSNAEVWALLGNALARIPDVEAAVKSYQVALRLNPGQIDLMIECARLLETSGNSDKAAELIDTYARSFPDDTKIAIAQAGWLERHGKRSAGRDILANLIARHGNDIHSRLALHNMLDAPADRYLNMHALLRIGAGGGPSRLLGFGHDIAASEILTMPESSIFFEFIRETALSGPTEALCALYSDFMPPTEPITEHFDSATLSDNWDARGTPISAISGSYNIQASADMTEAYLRLKRSELLRDGFIEVHLGESVGAFWLYARRSSRTMIRFGFNDDGFIRIQSWKNGEIRTGDSTSWIRPSGDIVLRLEVRGDGAMGYVDGQPMFTDALDAIRSKARHISALAPVLFEQAPDGTVLSTPLADFMPFRMFCSYHRIRLMPAVSLDYYSNVNAETLVRII